jgi:phage terminase small subunit
MKDSTLEKHKRVIDEWFVNGRNGTDAYMKVYPKSSYDTASVNFTEILRNTKILEYKESKEEKTATKLQITLESILLDLEDDKESARKANQFGVSVKASTEQAKLLGFYEADNKQKLNTENKNWFDELPIEAQIEIIKLKNGVKSDKQ